MCKILSWSEAEIIRKYTRLIKKIAYLKDWEIKILRGKFSLQKDVLLYDVATLYYGIIPV